MTCPVRYRRVEQAAPAGRPGLTSGVAKRLLAVSVLLAAAALPGCTYDRTEPGFFRSQAPRPSAAASNPVPDPPPPANPELPVAGEQYWTTADGFGVRVRVAVHAVRRSPGATVLDWSVTPVAHPGQRLGDPLPRSVELGLSDNAGSTVTIALVDRERVYRPLAHISAQFFHHCLCTQVWLAQQSLRVGVTTLMQVAYPPLPAPTASVDVLFGTVPTVFGVPVIPEGQVPTAGRPGASRPTRPADPDASIRFSYPGSADRRQQITVDRVVAGPTSTSVAWTIATLNDQRDLRLRPFGPPVNRIPAGPGVVNANATDGLTLRRTMTDRTWRQQRG